MKFKSENVFATLITASLLFASSPLTLAEDKPGLDSKSKVAAASPEEMMKKAEALGQPGPAHKALDPLVGEWTVDARCWMSPDGSPVDNKGTAKVRWILGGRFVQEEFSGEFMGRSFQGISITGYDNMKKKYVGSWVDSMATGMFITEGTADPSGKTFTFHGKMDDPMTGQKNKPIKMVIHLVDANKHTFEMHDLSLGEKSKTMEMTYTRKSPSTAAKISN